MKKKTNIVIGLTCGALLCFGAGCAELSELEKYQAEGYTVMVTYDANGGRFMESEGISIIDMFNPSDYTVEPDGKVHIKLLEPLDNSRPTSVVGETIKLSRSGYCFAGWYQNRSIRTVKGNPVDEDGIFLTEQDNGTYVYTDTLDDEKPKQGIPAYDYSGYWDFEEDYISYSAEDHAETNGIYSMTLYAGWVPYYEFDYYSKINGEWVLYDTTSFDYNIVNSNENLDDQDTIWLPQWSDGAMSYTHVFKSTSEYVFPKIKETTFNSAYSDPNCETKLVESLEHPGTLIPSYGENKELKVENRVQNVYVTFDEGERYRISTPQQLQKYASSTGIYDILCDLDFTGLDWPTAFEGSEQSFTGKIYSSEGVSRTLSNIVATHKTKSANGGLFSSVGAGAVIENVVFKDVIFDLAYTENRLFNTAFGLFAGYIYEGATINNVSVNGTFKIGAITGIGYNYYLLAGGNVQGVSMGDISVVVYGTEKVDGSGYRYTVAPESLQVSEDGVITFRLVTETRQEDCIVVYPQTAGDN